MLTIDEYTLTEWIARIGIRPFLLQLMEYIKEDFMRWDHFSMNKRHATYVPNGVIELMPISSKEYYCFKYVNGHPHNVKQNKLTVVAFGVFADVASGYPLLISAMTVLTALRTAATNALAAQKLARQESRRLAIIGCGAQSEFQVLAHSLVFKLTEIRYFDKDPQAMQRFAQNLSKESLPLRPMTSIHEAVTTADIIITATAAPGKQRILTWDMLAPGQHINAIGGDAPGKTELDPSILEHSKIVVEYFPQTHHEGEIQNLGARAEALVYASLWELLCGKKIGREHAHEITLFDSVGFALEDYSALRFVYHLATTHQFGQKIPLIPHDLTDSKNLFGLLLRGDKKRET